MRLPQEICDAVVLCVENKVSFDSPYKWFNSRRDAVRDLASLRLVNRGCCVSASPQLFRHIVVIRTPFQKVSPLVRLVEISKSPYAVYVQRLDVGFQFFEYLGVEPLLLYLEDLAGLLPGCLARLPNINALGFHITPSSLPWGKEAEAINIIIASLVSNLTELEITLPTARHFLQLLLKKAGTLELPIKHTLQGLRHLGLHVGDQEIPYCRPDQIHVAYPFQLVNLATNINSFALSSNCLLNLIHFQFIYLRRLKSLDLKGARTSTRALTAITEQSREQLRSIRFCDLTIDDSGLWGTIFERLGRLPRLIDVDIGSCRYLLSGANRRLVESPPFPPAWPQAILSQSVSDGWALRNLLLQVNTNRTAAGLPMMPESPYKCSYWGSPYGLGRMGMMDNVQSLVYSLRVVMEEYSLMGNSPHGSHRHDAKL